MASMLIDLKEEEKKRRYNKLFVGNGRQLKCYQFEIEQRVFIPKNAYFYGFTEYLTFRRRYYVTFRMTKDSKPQRRVYRRCGIGMNRKRYFNYYLTGRIKRS